MMEQKNNYCVYIHRNIIDNKSYIGMTKYGEDPNKRWRNGNGYEGCTYFYNAIQKYGWGNFEHIIWCDHMTEEQAKEWEIRLIALFDTTNSDSGYNIAIGGDCSWSIDDVDSRKRALKALEMRNKNRISKSIEKFKDRFDNGDKNIFKCLQCGAYFEKCTKTHKHRPNKKYCDYCSRYHRQNKKIITCIDCGKEIVVSSMDSQTCRCNNCKIVYKRNYQREYMKNLRALDI